MDRRRGNAGGWRWLAATLVLLPVLVVAGHAAPASAATPATSLVWSASSSFDPTYAGGLTAVSCASATLCAGVDGEGGATRWDGTTWTTPQAISGMAALSAVACPSPTVCVAVDRSGHASVGNGTSWSAATAVDGSTALTALSCPSANFCMAVDSKGNALTWNGATWTTSHIDGTTALDTVSCATTTFCVVGDNQGYTLRWTGASWGTPVDVDGTLEIDAVSCASSAFCAIVVGGSFLETSTDGTTWTFGTNTGGLNSLSCPSATLCQAVGGASVITWNGTTWSSSVAIGGTPVFGTPPSTVSCASATFCAVSEGWGGMVTWNGTTWATPVVVNPKTGTPTSLSCASATMCMSVDSFGNAYRWDGASWSGPASFAEPTQVGLKQTVSCPTTTFCAVGTGLGAVSTWNGTSWSAPLTVDPLNALTALSCASPTSCVATDGPGRFMVLSGTTWTPPADSGDSYQIQSLSCVTPTFCAAADSFERVLFWNGATWSAPVSLHYIGGLSSISCPTTTDCVAVDLDGNAFSWNGSTWSSYLGMDTGANSPNPLESVSCPSPTSCTAVDLHGNLLTFDGSSWGNPADGDGANDLVAVSCPSTTSCVAVDSSGNALIGRVPVPLPYTPVTPTRICDTRAAGPGVDPNQCNGYGSGTGTLSDDSGGTIAIPDLPTGATAAVLNVTVTGTSAPSYLTVWPTGVPQPTTSDLNWSGGQTVASLVEVALGPGDEVDLFNATGSADVIVDLEGFVAPSTPGAGLYTPLAPARICDTRGAGPGVTANQCDHNGTSPGTLGTGGVTTIHVTGSGDVPSTGVSAVVLNVTVTGTSAPSYLTAWPTGVARPTASNVNWVAGQTVANRVVVPVGSGGQVSLFDASGSVDVIVDVTGWFTDASNSSATGADYVALAPARICDTRASGPGVAANQCDGNGSAAGTLGTAGSRTVQVTGNGGVPSAAVAVVATVTVADTTAPSYLTVWPDGTGRPTASDINWPAHQVAPNLVVAKLGADGAVGLFNASGSADTIVDVGGYYIDPPV